ncbi:hypothetical protein FRC05_004539 [Tulasnella sp. 425]|nr:hypothetical protein FRC05_004539 [Tulasnella sp. 425]
MSFSSTKKMVTEEGSDGREDVQSLISFLSAVVPNFPSSSWNAPLKTGRVTHIVIICLTYPGIYYPQHNIPLKLSAPKNDFELLLRHFDYCHKQNSVQFTLLNDFDIDFTDSTGVERGIERTDTSRDSIRCAIQKIMCTAEPNAKIVFFFGGHGGIAEVNMMGGTSGDECDFQTIIAGDGRRIYGKELRSWFCEARYPTISVTTVFDTGNSAGSLGALPLLLL